MQTLTYITVALTLALLDAGVWSLVIAHVASYVTYLAALIAVASERVAAGMGPGDRSPARRAAGAASSPRTRSSTRSSRATGSRSARS